MVTMIGINSNVNDMVTMIGISSNVNDMVTMIGINSNANDMVTIIVAARRCILSLRPQPYSLS
jgi:hypothetical protein